MGITPAQQLKLDKLIELAASWGSCAIAYSGGVDSTFLAKAVNEVLKENSMVVIATSSTYPKREYAPAIEWLEKNGIRYESIVSEELDIPEFRNNPPDRCYFCKRELFQKIIEIARKNKIKVIADGANSDDTGDFRPGMSAAKELGVVSPLRDLGFTKQDIRQLSASVYGLASAFKQPMACLASRFPYGSLITAERLSQVEKVEDFLASLGFSTFRARHHGDVLRIELDKKEMRRVLKNGLADKLVEKGQQAGFAYVTLDLQGFRTGSMNEVLIF